MASLRSIISEKVQEHLRRANWKAAIREMERLFALDPDPLIRVRIGDIRRKLDHEGEAIRDYVLAAGLFAEKGFVAKALAQYRLALRLDPSNTDIRSRMERLRLSYPIARLRREPAEYRVPEPAWGPLPHYSRGG
jgi:tetratricopeptide (TPR) repeat protein